MNTTAPPTVGISAYWTRPASRQEWESELRFLRPLGPPYRPWTRVRSVVWAITWVALFEGLIHAGRAHWVALTVWAIGLITLLALLLRALCYQDDEQRMRFARLQPRETVTDVEIERLKQVPDLYREFLTIEASDIPLLVGDLDSLRTRLERRAEIWVANAPWTQSPVVVKARWNRLKTWIVGLAALVGLAEALRVFA